MDDSENPLLITTGLPRFHLIEAKHIGPAITQVLDEAYTKIEQLEENYEPSWKGLIEPLEQITAPFEYAWNPIKHFLGVKNLKEIREEHDKHLSQVVQFGLRMGQSKPVYDGLLNIRDGSEWMRLDDAQKRVIQLKIRDAKHSGVGLSGTQKERFNQISQELSQLGTDFSNHVLDATKAYELIIEDKVDSEGWPNTLRQLTAQSYNQAKETESASPEDGPWRITLEAPILIPFLQHSRNRIHREQIFRSYVSRASEGKLDNKPLIKKILKLKHEKANLLGFNKYAELSLDSKMAPDQTAVEKMFTELFDASKPHSIKDFEELEHIAKTNGFNEPLKHWDLSFWAERLKENRFKFTDDELRPYFPLPKVLEGMFGLVEELFGIRIKQVKGEAPVWHPDVTYYKVYENDEQIASFYLDAYSRPETKRGGAWMDSCLDRKIVDGEVRLPVVYLNANGTPPIGDRPSLMSFRELTTLFHEFGHGLQGMMSNVDYQDVSGVNGIEWDAVETASQFMENWCYHKPTLMTISGHWETGEPLPDDLFKKVLAAKVFRAGTAMLRQLEFGMTDMELHSNYDPYGDETAFDVHRRIALKTSILPPMEEDRFLCAFAHIFAGGYAAGYYSYKWAEVLSADLYSAFEEVGLENKDRLKELGTKYRNTILLYGGSKDPMEVFKEFIGREPSTEALLRHNNLLD